MKKVGAIALASMLNTRIISFMNQETNEVWAFSITQVTEAGNLNHMEKLAFQKLLNEVRA